MHWLAEQGLAPKSVFFIFPLLIFLVTSIVNNLINKEEAKQMEKHKNAIDVLSVALNIINHLSGNIAGGALLTNALYMT